VAVAEGVVDRANGHGDTLAQDATFTADMNKLAGDRFGTLYVNVRQLLQDFHVVTGSNAGQSGLNNYGAGYGSLQFTDAGMRLTFTLEVKGGKTYALSGDSNASAGVVPSSTILYEGLGNFSGFYQELKDEAGGLVTDQGFTQTLGLSPNDPLFNSPVSLALLTPSADDANNVIDPLVMLHSSLDAATINAKVQQALETLGYKSSTETVDGTQATKIQADGATVYYEVLGHDLVFAYDADGLSQAIDTFNGKTGSLAASSTFKALVSQAPKNNAESLFISLENLENAPGELGQTYHQLVGSTGLLTKVTASYLTYNSDGSGVTITEDIALK
jgi:hypothetical protein